MTSAATWINLEMITPDEVSQTEKDKYHVISLIFRILKIIQITLFTKQKQTHGHRKQTYGCQRAKKWGEGDKLGVWD